MVNSSGYSWIDIPHVIRMLLNMYADQQIRVLWDGEYSHCFSIKNGVKQGAIVSPILFSVYPDVLLTELKRAGLGCFIGTCMFCHSTGIRRLFNSNITICEGNMRRVGDL